MKKPIVSVVVGSDSDLPIIKEAIEILEQFNIWYEIFILSAHRSPEETAKYAKNIFERGIKVVIAGAGGSAHLAGVIASYFPLPVVGVPIKNSPLSGLDSLYSIVQMPPGVPVATIGINEAKNAGLLAVQILAINNKRLQKRIINYKKSLCDNVLNKSKKLKELGLNQYLKLMKK